MARTLPRRSARHAQALALLDQAEMRFGLGRDEADGQAAGARPAGAADAVDVVIRRARQVEVDHHGQLGDVDAARGHIGGHDHLQVRWP